MKGIVGIYKIENNKTSQCYIGQSKDIVYRWFTHLNQLDTNSHHNPKLQLDWIRYGRDNFSFSLLAVCKKEDLNSLEKVYIDKYGYYNCKASSQDKYVLQQTILKTDVENWLYNGFKLMDLITENILIKEDNEDNIVKYSLLNINNDFYKSFYEVLRKEKNLKKLYNSKKKDK